MIWRHALTRLIRAGLDDIQIILYEDTSRDAQRAGRTVNLHAVHAFSTGNLRELAKISAFSIAGGRIVANLVTRRDATALGVAGVWRAAERREVKLARGGRSGHGRRPRLQAHHRELGRPG